MTDYHWLTSEEALQAIAEACAETEGSHISAKDLMRIRKRFSLEKTQQIASQFKLRQRAVTRFPQAAEMLFTDRSLKQATDAAIAQFKAKLIRELDSDVQHVTDLCCGMGGDLQALANHFSVTGVDQDPEICAIAQHNASLHSHSTVETIVEDVAQLQLKTDWVHIDPDRRHDGRRHTDINALQPGIETLQQLIDQVGSTLRGVSIKIAPASTIPKIWHARCQLFWIQSRNECRQQLAVFTTKNMRWNHRTALAIDKDGTSKWEYTASNTELLDSGEVPLKGSADRFLYEPKPAILAGQLAPSWAASHHLQYIHSGVAYFTSDFSREVAGGTCYEILEELPFDLKQIKRHLKKHDIGRLEIKKRGIDLTPEQLRKDLKPKGNNGATLIIAGNPRSKNPTTAYIANCRTQFT